MLSFPLQVFMRITEQIVPVVLHYTEKYIKKTPVER